LRLGFRRPSAQRTTAAQRQSGRRGLDRATPRPGRLRGQGAARDAGEHL